MDAKLVAKKWEAINATPKKKRKRKRKKKTAKK